MTEKMKQVAVKLHPKDWETIQKIAKLEGTTAAEFIRQAIAEAIDMADYVNEDGTMLEWVGGLPQGRPANAIQKTPDEITHYGEFWGGNGGLYLIRFKDGATIVIDRVREEIYIDGNTFAQKTPTYVAWTEWKERHDEILARLQLADDTFFVDAYNMTRTEIEEYVGVENP